MSLAAAAIGAGASIAGGFLSNDANYQAEMRNLENTRRLMKEQNDFNVRMWNVTNRYNSPSNQLELLKQAGVNPAVYDFGGGHSAASEVTAASGSAPYNQDAGRGFSDAAAGISQAAASTIQALQVDAQIAKLRSDIKYQDLRSRDLQNQLEADEELMPIPGQSDYEDNGDNNFSMTVLPGKNRYQEKRARERLDIIGESQRQDLTAEQLEVYLATKPFLKRLPEQQLRSLSQDIREKALNNELLESDVQMMRKYGISPRDSDGWRTLIKMALRDPGALDNVFDRLIGEPIRRYWPRNNSHSNPLPGSW